MSTEFVPIPEKFIKAGLEPKYVEFSNKYNLAAMQYHQIPISEYRANPDGGMELLSMARRTYDFRGKIVDHRVPVKGGEIVVRQYVPQSAIGSGDPKPTYIAFHGGGWVIGGLATEEEFVKRVCIESGAIGFNVDYRLAPEHPFPRPVEDCYAALQWIVSNADTFGVNKDKIAIGGCSAGGHLTGEMAHKARDAGIKLCFQFLGVPCCDSRAASRDGKDVAPDCPYDSWRDNCDIPALSAVTMAWFYGHFLGIPRPKEYDTNPDVNLILRSNFEDLAPALVLTAEFDILRDEGEAYAKKMQEHGVDCKLVRIKGAVHSCMVFDKVLDTGYEFNSFAVEAIKAAFSR